MTHCILISESGYSTISPFERRSNVALQASVTSEIINRMTAWNHSSYQKRSRYFYLLILLLIDAEPYIVSLSIVRRVQSPPYG